jgi:hypothetical protein
MEREQSKTHNEKTTREPVLLDEPSIEVDIEEAR